MKNPESAPADSKSDVYSDSCFRAWQLDRMFEMRPYVPPSMAACRSRRHTPSLQLNERLDRATGKNRLTIAGLCACRRAFCAGCAPALMRHKAGEISQAITRWGHLRAYIGTFTSRHSREMPLELLSRLQSQSFGNLFSGRAGRELAAALGGPWEPPQSVRKAQPLDLAALVPPDTEGLGLLETCKAYKDRGWAPAKPHTVRAIEVTWSVQHGFHPHLHCAMFLHRELTDEALQVLLTPRWIEAQAMTLQSWRDMLSRVLDPVAPVLSDAVRLTWRDSTEKKRLAALRRWARAQTERGAEPLPPVSLRKRWAAEIEDGAELADVFDDWLVKQARELRGRCEKLFGQEVFPRTVPLRVSAEAVERMMRSITEKAIEPDPAYAVRVEQMRTPGKAANYLAKAGLEVAGMMRKEGKIDERGIEHFGPWQLQSMVADASHPLHAQAVGAWSELLRATTGRQLIVWSQGARAALGIAEVRDEDVPQLDVQEPGELKTAEQELPELTRVAGIIPGEIWSDLAARYHQQVAARIFLMHHEGRLDELEAMGIMQRPAELGKALDWRVVEPERPEDPAPKWWQRWEKEGGLASYDARACEARGEPVRLVMGWDAEAGEYALKRVESEPGKALPPRPERVQLKPIDDAARVKALERFTTSIAVVPAVARPVWEHVDMPDGSHSFELVAWAPLPGFEGQPSADSRITFGPITEKDRPTAYAVLAEISSHNMRFEDAFRGLERAHVPGKERQFAPWERRTPEEKEEALHAARDTLEAMRGLIGGARPRSRTIADGAAATVDQPVEDEQPEPLLLGWILAVQAELDRAREKRDAEAAAAAKRERYRRARAERQMQPIGASRPGYQPFIDARWVSL